MACSSATESNLQALPPAVEKSAANRATTTSPVAEPEGRELATGRKLLAHRGVHQTFDPEGVDDETCTATRIGPPVHDFIENTLPSMEAAFAAGASVVEIDIAPSSDGVLVVFHDWEVGCRTNGSGEIRSLNWEELSKLDVGYGYTSDGVTFPLREKGQGLLPRLEDVFAAFPDGRFLINFKSGDPSEASLLDEVVTATNATDQVWAVYGALAAVEAYGEATETRGFSEAIITACLAEYLAAPDSDVLLAACEDTVVAVPLDIAPVLTGWPDAFVASMAKHGTDVIVSGPGLTGIDTAEALNLVPQDLDVYVWTNRIEDLRAG